MVLQSRPIRPVPASDFIQIAPSLQRILIDQGGAVPVNDVYLPYWTTKNKIELFYGSYGSGKSDFIAAKLVNACLTDTYFRCYFGRKQYVDVRKSCFSTIVKVIKRMGVEHLFHFSEAPTSGMYIKCLLNGNEFYPFGSEDPENLKSVDDPTHFWCEELNQFDEADFKMIFSRLRTIKAKTQFIGSFNTEFVFDNHWIRRFFFPETVENKALLPQSDILAGVNIARIKSIYTDNSFQDPAYLQTLIISAGGDIQYLGAIARGDWGVINNKKPWLHAFKELDHTADDVPFNVRYPVYLSFDFNNDPFACTAWQFSPNFGEPSSFIHCIRQFSGHLKIEDMAREIRAAFPSSILYITGDRSGQNEDLGRNQTLYQMLASLLRVPAPNLNLNTANLEHADSRMLLNVMFYNYPSIKISRRHCPTLILQCKNAKPNPKSKNPNELLKDRNIDGGIHCNDEFDSMRYLFQTYFNEWAKAGYLNVIK